MILALGLLSGIHAYSQNIPKFGIADRVELEMKECSFEKEAAAMNLLDITEVELEVFETARIITEKRIRIKIFNEEGFKAASIKIPYFSQKRSTKIKDFDAFIYNLDEKGNIITEKLEKKDLFKESLGEKVKSITFTFPHVKKGSVIEYRYTKIEKNEVRLDPWVVQDIIPTAYASSTVTIPNRAYLRTKTFGFDSIPFTPSILNANSNYPKHRRYYKKENIHSFKAEPFMSSQTDNLLRMVYEVLPDLFLLKDPKYAWKSIGHRLMISAYFGKHIKAEIPGTNAIIDSAKKIPSTSGKIEFIYESVRKQIPEVLGQHFVSEDVAEAWKEKNGTTADVNLILLNLLRKAGVSSHPLLVSTRENGMVSMEFPSLSQINSVDVIALDSNRVYILDASQKQSYQIPPANILNRNVYMLDSADMKWIYIEDPRHLQKSAVKINAQLNENGLVKGEAVYRMFDYSREQALDTSDVGEKEKLFASKQVGVKILSVKNENIGLLHEPVIQKMNFEYEPGTAGNFYYFNPQFLGNQDKNPFLQKERQTDIDFGSNQKISMELIVSLPKGFSIEHLPKNVLMRSSDTTISYSRMIFSDESTIVYRQDFEIRRPFFFREEYKAVHEFFEKMFAYLQEELVFKKN